MQKLLIVPLLMTAAAFSAAEETREIEMTVTSDVTTSESESGRIRLDLDINGEQVELDLSLSDLNDPEQIESLISQLPPSTQSTVRRELEKVHTLTHRSGTWQQSDGNVERRVVMRRQLEEHEGDGPHMVVIQSNDESNSMTSAELIIRMINFSELSDDDVASIQAALSDKAGQ